MIDNVFIYLLDLPHTVKALTRINEDETYTIFINARLNIEQQRDSYLHELKHIYGDDFTKDIDINTMELIRHIKRRK